MIVCFNQVTRGGEAVNMIYMNDGLFGTLRYNEPWHTVKRFEVFFSIQNLVKFVV